MAEPFTHLHASSAFSAHYGVSWPEELAAAAAADGASALACTDRDGLYGAVKHLGACRAHGLDPIVGVDLAVLAEPEATNDDGAHPGGRKPRRGAAGEAGRVVVLAHGGNQGAGWRALCRLISDAHAHTNGHANSPVPPGVLRSELAARCLDPESGKPVLTVLLGPGLDVGRALSGRRFLRPRTLFREWLDAMPAGVLAVELVTHLTAPGEPLSTGHAVRMLRLATEHHVPAVLTNAVRYVEEGGAATAEILDAARTLTPLAPSKGEAWLKPAALMRRAAREIVEAAGLGAKDLANLLGNTERIADRCRLDPVEDAGWGRPVVPEASVIGIAGEPIQELAERCRAGISRRFPEAAGKLAASVEARLGHELEVIGGLGFASYFLTVAEVADMIRGMGVRSAARGSGASSLVNYLLGISQVDPLRHDLIFERFLSLDRSTLPDIDIDVESAERHHVYRKIFERFGSERVTLMSMQNAYRARGAVRDAGRALGLDQEEVGDIAKQLWRFDASQFREALAEKPELRDLGERVGKSEQLELLVDLTERLDRLPRHISMHPCGVILGDAGLLDRTPVQPSGMGLPMSQFDKQDMDPMGMLKLDVLGVRMQSSMAFAVREVERIEGTTIDLDAVPFDDEPTYELIRSTHTLGCFQIESPGQRELVGKMAPRDFNDLIIDISLFRPGPMKSDMVRPFLEHRFGFAPERYPHPDMKPFLAETHGVTIFHEQILRTFDLFTGCGLAQADVFRRLLGNAAREPEVEAYFREHAAQRGYSPDVVESVWGTLKAFGSFGFCKAHGAAFAVPTYQSSWLKAHHPEAFLAGIFEHDPGMYPKRLLVAEARRLGIPILPVDINASRDEYRLERIDAGPDAGKLGIRLALKGIYGLSGNEVRRIVDGQPYASLAELRDRARVTRASLRRLAELGAFDSLHRAAADRGSRADLVAHLAELAPRPVRRDDAIEGQLSLEIGDVELANLPSGLPEPSLDERVRRELDLMSVDASAHLMDSHRPLLDRLGVTAADKLLDLHNGTEVLVAGVRVATQTPPMHGGKRVVFISVDDGTGCVDSAFFTDAQERCGPLLFGTPLLLIRGRTRRSGPRGISVNADMAWDLAEIERTVDPERPVLPGPRPSSAA
ncbi:DNA polymerase III subunit alpha [Sinomonas albida]|uniref:DNA polymerase III subunit alpha n=1 Tax=Sinomonas albida TaxID=369942 RepID=UPI00301846F7